MLHQKARSEGQNFNPSTGLRIILHGELDTRQLLRDARSAANVTGTVGWARRRSDGTVEVVAFRPHGLQDFLQSIESWTHEAEGVRADFAESFEAEGASNFRIRREEFLLENEDDIAYYDSLGVDTTSRQFPALHSSGLLRKAKTAEVEQVQKYWATLWGTTVDPSFHIAFSNVTGVFDERVVPQAEYRSVWRALNPGESTLRAYSDKLIFSRLIQTQRQPVTPLVCLDGRFYDAEANWLPNESEVLTLLSNVSTGIIKPTSMDNGRGVERLEYAGDGDIRVGNRSMNLRELTRRYRKNFMVQEIVRQHETLAAPHADSLNTLRVVTLRWEGAVHDLLTFARFGSEGRINDNAGTGGLCVGVGSDGTLNDYAINEQGVILSSHPTSGVVFRDMEALPSYNDVIEFAKQLHSEVPYFDLLSWDVALDPTGSPILIECNFRGAVWLYQLATGQPLFGDFTHEVLSAVRRHSGS